MMHPLDNKWLLYEDNNVQNFTLQAVKDYFFFGLFLENFT